MSYFTKASTICFLNCHATHAEQWNLLPPRAIIKKIINTIYAYVSTNASPSYYFVLSDAFFSQDVVGAAVTPCRALNKDAYCQMTAILESFIIWLKNTLNKEVVLVGSVTAVDEYNREQSAEYDLILKNRYSVAKFFSVMIQV